MILIVDDFVMSGDFLSALKRVLKDAGVSMERVRTASIATTKVAVRNHKGPDYYWWLADDDEFFFPWGKAR
jgi:hypoxanthine phosphoribosyltransferase